MFDNQTLLFLIHIQIIGDGTDGICGEHQDLDGTIGPQVGIRMIGVTDNQQEYMYMITVKQKLLEVKNQLLVLVFKQLQINK